VSHRHETSYSLTAVTAGCLYLMTMTFPRTKWFATECSKLLNWFANTRKCVAFCDANHLIFIAGSQREGRVARPERRWGCRHNADTCRQLFHWGWYPLNFHIFTSPKTRGFELPFGVNCKPQHCKAFYLYHDVTHRWTDTDRQSGRPLSYILLHFAKQNFNINMSE